MGYGLVNRWLVVNVSIGVIVVCDSNVVSPFVT